MYFILTDVTSGNTGKYKAHYDVTTIQPENYIAPNKIYCEICSFTLLNSQENIDEILEESYKFTNPDSIELIYPNSDKITIDYKSDDVISICNSNINELIINNSMTIIDSYIGILIANSTITINTFNSQYNVITGNNNLSIYIHGHTVFKINTDMNFYNCKKIVIPEFIKCDCYFTNCDIIITKADYNEFLSGNKYIASTYPAEIRIEQEEPVQLDIIFNTYLNKITNNTTTTLLSHFLISQDNETELNLLKPSQSAYNKTLCNKMLCKCEGINSNNLSHCELIVKLISNEQSIIEISELMFQSICNFIEINGIMSIRYTPIFKMLIERKLHLDKILNGFVTGENVKRDWELIYVTACLVAPSEYNHLIIQKYIYGPFPERLSTEEFIIKIYDKLSVSGKIKAINMTHINKDTINLINKNTFIVSNIHTMNVFLNNTPSIELSIDNIELYKTINNIEKIIMIILLKQYAIKNIKQANEIFDKLYNDLSENEISIIKEYIFTDNTIVAPNITESNLIKILVILNLTRFDLDIKILTRIINEQQEIFLYDNIFYKILLYPTVFELNDLSNNLYNRMKRTGGVTNSEISLYNKIYKYISTLYNIYQDGSIVNHILTNTKISELPELVNVKQCNNRLLYRYILEGKSSFSQNDIEKILSQCNSNIPQKHKLNKLLLNMKSNKIKTIDISNINECDNPIEDVQNYNFHATFTSHKGVKSYSTTMIFSNSNNDLFLSVMKEAPVYTPDGSPEKFSVHPFISNEVTLGWVRFHEFQEKIIIEEIQTDFSKRVIKENKFITDEIYYRIVYLFTRIMKSMGKTIFILSPESRKQILNQPTLYFVYNNVPVKLGYKPDHRQLIIDGVIYKTSLVF